MNRRTFLYKTAAGLAGTACFPSLMFASGSEGKPNLIMILVDDMGWKDTGFAGNIFVDTPHIDRLAQNGIIFKQAYAAAPNCAPTRACLMTGQYTPRHGIYTVVDDRHKPGRPHHKILAAQSRESLNTNADTIAESLGRQGYATGMVGMWNLGRGRRGPQTPTGQGFDIYREPKDLGFEKDAYKNDKGEYLTHKMTGAGIDFIQQNSNNPFFLYMAYHAVHAPFDAEPALLAKYEEKADGLKTQRTRYEPAFAAAIESLDKSIGTLSACLQKMGIAENTYILFTSDNGGSHRTTAPLRGGKGSLYEGGIRVPAFVSGPGINPGQTSQVPINTIDYYPTLLDLAGAPARPVDGLSLVPVMKDGKALSRKNLYWHFPCYIGRGTPSSAVRQGDTKLIEFFETNTIEMYNLSDDPGETHNLVEQHPEKAQLLYGQLRAWQAETAAPRPTSLNPNYDPKAVPQRGRNQRKKRKRKRTA